jgi:hypothetical protein
MHNTMANRVEQSRDAADCTCDEYDKSAVGGFGAFGVAEEGSSWEKGANTMAEWERCHREKFLHVTDYLQVCPSSTMSYSADPPP